LHHKNILITKNSSEMRRTQFSAGRRQTLIALAALTAQGLCNRDASANTAARPIKIVVQEAGAQTDAVARVFLPAFAQHLKQDVYIENHGGAGGRIAARIVAQSAPDGLTIGFGGANNLVLAGLLERDIGYDPERDFTYIAALARVPYALAVRHGLEVTNLATLVNYARRHPGQLSFGSAGVGGSSHLTVAAIAQHYDIDLLHVPFRGSNLATIEMISDRLDIVATDIARLLPHANTGKLRVIAVTGASRSSYLPNVPTLEEQGLHGFFLEPWYGMYGPKGLPGKIVDHLTRATRLAFADAGVRSRAEGAGLELLTPTAVTLHSLIASDRRRYAPIVERLNLRSGQ
jgi:tripartite-type tricarboxylate transporter receptor subunit TctC